MTIQHPLPIQARIDAVVIGTLLELPHASAPRVVYPGCPDTSGVVARCTALLGPADIGGQVALMFEGGDPACPLVIGRLLGADAPPEPVASVRLDEHCLELSAEREIVLRCGKASITLTRAGKVIIQGAYLSSRSSGVNRIKGGSVQIN
ncbi:hypothetical protein SAMN04489802_2624 [Pseudomonas chlororaphis]|uniref:DUF6484 domain-containing protein n=1 Tax=Pseudomonas TaxID=286 RepID=UPI00087ADEC6|nr:MULTISPECIES: DUF6484 domain-containing protein [Pseudomonas]AZD67785.1 hypothetical protein C4K17_3901 [Pseudomonas chlororaphis subsp. aurantiaca]AZD86757.1 hypothetical protein C4K14_3935 [Pseudomonas chlororaphis subsp. aureofaciens]QIT23735.1 hypothetical protein HCN09_19100 [Pseudomonas chlororaphis subsp. aurantiaca]QQX56480.1 hypothetical protein JHW28_17850 [Pseudomonas chlororaphis subsp. aurantiaca]UUT22363.1 DUF6484 domain-containing protein [Pseudomonas sp. T8]